MRLIDADALREGWLEWDIYDEIEANTVLYSIDDQPTINPEDLRPKGKWEDYSDKFDRGMDLRCSICHHRASEFVGGSEDWWDAWKPRYCPSCGAKMEE